MSYGYHYSSGEPAFAVFMMIFTMIYILVMFGIVAAAYISRWFIFKKMGMPGWKGIIPYYGEYLLFRELWTTKMFWALVISAAVYAFVSIFAVVFGMVGFAVAVAGAHSSHAVGQAATGGDNTDPCIRVLRTAHDRIPRIRAGSQLQAQQPSG